MLVSSPGLVFNRAHARAGSVCAASGMSQEMNGMKIIQDRVAGIARVVVALSATWALAGGQIQAQEVVLPAEATPPPDVAAELLMQEPRVGLVKWGPFDIIPRINSSVYYDDAVRRTPKEDDVVVAIAPGILAVARDMADGIGKELSVDYSPALLFYTQGSRGDEITHNGTLRGGLHFSKLSLGMSQQLQLISDPDVDISARTRRDNYRTALTSRYAVGAKSSVEVNLSLDITDFRLEQYSDRWQVANQNWFNYEYSPRLTTGLGVTVGYLEIEDAPNQTFEQALLRAVYAVAEKVTLSVSGGAEVRQYRGGVSDRVSPVWSALGAYRPRDGTTVTLEAFQQFRNSASQGGQDLMRTGGMLTLRQRIYGEWNAMLSATYYHSDYQATATGVVATRTDDSFLARAGLDRRLWERWRAGVFYDYHQNRSNIERYDYDRHRVGARVAWSY
jgi:hypothetical protein